LEGSKISPRKGRRPVLALNIEPHSDATSKGSDVDIIRKHEYAAPAAKTATPPGCAESGRR
ncbi:MAG: hypothetical protein AAFV29_19875, partial [Myxococcota bacterium]